MRILLSESELNEGVERLAEAMAGYITEQREHDEPHAEQLGGF